MAVHFLEKFSNKINLATLYASVRLVRNPMRKMVEPLYQIACARPYARLPTGADACSDLQPSPPITNSRMVIVLFTEK